MSFKDCKVCQSPFRRDIEKLHRKGYGPTEIAKHYWTEMGYAHLKNCADKMRLHFLKKHPPPIEDIVPVTPLLALEQEKEAKLMPVKESTKGYPMNIENYAQELLEMGFTEDMMKKVRPAQILQAQKILIEKEKLKTQRDALKFTMAKFMAGLATPEDEIEMRSIADAETAEGLPE